MRFVVMLSMLALVACGGQETAPARPGAADGTTPTPPVSARPEAAPAAAPTAPAAAAAPAAPAATTAGDSARCLDLVRQAEFALAVPICVAALDADPTNTQVQDALATARAEAGKLADAEGAAQAAGDAAATGAADAAGGAAEGAAKDLTGKMGQ